MNAAERKTRFDSWKEQVKRAESSGYFKVRGRAERYIETRLGPAWRLAIAADDNTPVVGALGLTETMALLIHLFALAVHRHGGKRTRAPMLSGFLPASVGGVERFLRAVPKTDIAAMVGKTASQVDRAIASMRGKQPKFEVLKEKRIAFPMYVGTGIMLDVMLEPQQSFAFMREEYEHARSHAVSQHYSYAPTNDAQREHAGEAIRMHSTTPQAALPVQQDVAGT